MTLLRRMTLNGTQRSLISGAALAALLALGGCATVGTCERNRCAEDQAITARVRSLFDQHPAIETPNIVSVETIDHIVYLDGLVDTPYQKVLAGSLAAQVDGVTRVVNMIGLSNNR
jgi:osmotically-inducible protein OsmY